MPVRGTNRREFIGGLGGAVTWPVVAHGQQPSKLWHIGILETVPADLNMPNLGALRRGLHDFGYVEGRDYVLEYRSADGQPEQFPRLATELVREQVDLIVTRGTPAARAARTATSATPIVMAAVGEALGTIERHLALNPDLGSDVGYLSRPSGRQSARALRLARRMRRSKLID